MREFNQPTKLRITWLILMGTGIGYLFGLHGRIRPLALLHTILGTSLLASGTATLDQWYEREADRLMRRTAGRPLPQGKMTPAHALAFGAALSVAGFPDLWLGVNLLAAAIGGVHAGQLPLCLVRP
jgi:protoheme IX farnesyltransferase